VSEHIVPATEHSGTLRRDARKGLRRVWGQMRASVAGQVGFEMEGLGAVARATDIPADVLAVDVVAQMARQAKVSVAMWTIAKVRRCGRLRPKFGA
jgi:hypothetical protein